MLANFGELYAAPRILSLIASAAIAVLAIGYSLLVLSALAAGAKPEQVGLSRTGAYAVIAAALLSLLYFIPGVQRAVFRVVKLRPGSPVAFLTVVLGLLPIAQQLGSQVQQVTQPLTYGDLLSQDIPFLVLAFVGVGIFVRRTPAETMQRLGLTAPAAAWWWLVALVAIGLFLAVAAGIEHVANIVAPEQQKQVTSVSNVLFSRFTSPAAVVFLGLLAGVVEETLFRGALLPVVGVVVTAILFAALHTQYALSFATLEVLVLGLALGWIRVYSKSTLPCMVTHAGYDIVVGLLVVVMPR